MASVPPPTPNTSPPQSVGLKEVNLASDPQATQDGPQNLMWSRIDPKLPSWRQTETKPTPNLCQTDPVRQTEPNLQQQQNVQHNKQKKNNKKFNINVIQNNEVPYGFYQ